MASKLIIGVGCLFLSLGAMAEESIGGLEGMIDQMEKLGATRDLQMGLDSGSAAATEQSAEGPSVNPVTRAVIPGRPAVIQPSRPAVAEQHSVHQPVATAIAPANAPAATPSPPRHNPLADQAIASGGLEQIFNIMELNASTPMRVSAVSPAPAPGASAEASLREKMAR